MNKPGTADIVEDGLSAPVITNLDGNISSQKTIPLAVLLSVLTSLHFSHGNLVADERLLERHHESRIPGKLPMSSRCRQRICLVGKLDSELPGVLIQAS